MVQKSSAQRLAEALVGAGKYASAPHAEAARARVPEGHRPFTVAISRQVGAGGTTTANAVGERLGWPVYDHQLLERIAEEMHLRVHLLESVDERHQPALLEGIQSFAQVAAVSENCYVRHLVETVLSLGAHGACIIVGRGAGHVLPPSTTLRVRVVADLEDRITFVCRDRGLARPDALRYLEGTESDRRRFVQGHFLRDPEDAQHYDLLLNSSRFGVAGCADLVVEALHRLEERARTTRPEATAAH